MAASDSGKLKYYLMLIISKGFSVKKLQKGLEFVVRKA